MLGQRDALGRQRREDESAVAVHPGRLGKAQLGADLVERLAITFAHRNTLQRTGIAERPAVIRAPEGVGVALLGVAQLIGPVGAAVERHPDHAVLAARHDDRVMPDHPGQVVTRLADLALVRDVDPSGLEDAVHFAAEDLGGWVHGSVHAVAAYDGPDVEGVCRRRGFKRRHWSSRMSMAGLATSPRRRKPMRTPVPIGGAVLAGCTVVITIRCPLDSSTSMMG